ncbi:Phage terminase-like protein, large subunit [Slackia heliotrinireducens]|uniref:Phage terminase-like protein, large subunit n=1 Tax=Slackia heliotrinireducens (strain ATCC 29202 / DSM 20476 / NCTC 11029 / RHS 1) TaxID=471855 RepID=C7N4P0_SLAHD|nr:terminase TerL endonuclease subunit [Slackia heliotrinireducens]ACV21875.1 phage terminase-like protein, large subunit [Slackia heliotrinireducens DSM 20476]VEG99647.1 Phage terminase-like protein, large subunit [Slackia heliotrinireducens]
MSARDYITEYWHAIESGAVTVCEKTRKAYERLAYEVENGRGRWVFDVEKGNRPIEFMRRFCRHSKGEWAGKPLELELWQKAFVCALFGFVDKDTGERRFNEALLCISRKGGKSTLAAGILLYLLTADGEPGAEVYTVATKLDQAKLIFDEAAHMVEQSPTLAKRIKKRRTDLYFAGQMSKMQPLGKNSNTLDGLNASAVCIDELHGITDRNLYEVMKQSMSTRRQPLLLMTTTAGFVRECIFDDMYEYAEKVLNGVIEDERFLAVVYELDTVEEWKDEKAWYKANPSLGTVKKLDDLRAKVERAKNSPNDLNGILCKDFNVRNTSAGAWLTFDDLNNTATFDLSDFKGCWAIGGADLSITTDLTAATLLMHRDGLFYVTQMYWIPEANLEKRVRDDKIPYDKWRERGLLRLCHGNTIDYGDVTAWFLEMVEFGITPAWIYYDSYSARYWVDEMQRHGFRMERTIQGAKTLSLPMQRLGADLQAKRINYNNSPILKWCISNTAIETDRNGNIVPVKNQKPRQRIDGLASLLDAYVGLNDHYNEFCDL